MVPFQPLEAGDPREIGGYRIAARLGAGGMGQVFLGATRSGRRLAIKVIRPDYAHDEQFRRRFRQEVEAAGRVQSIYTAPVVDADPDAPRPWLATAYLPGPSLNRAVDELGPLPADTARVLMAGVAEALQAIHSAGVVHRDLKPSNVLLAPDGPRVIDFGIARAADSTPLTRAGARIGSPQFMSPEQALGEPVSEAADVFALGATAYYAATGRTPFGEGDPAAVLYRIVHSAPDLTGCPDDLLPAVGSCLSRDPAARPSVRELIDALTAGNAATAVDWPPPSLAPELDLHRQPLPEPPTEPPAGRRRPTAVITAACSVLLVGTAVAFALTSGDDPETRKTLAAPTPTGTPSPTRPAAGTYRFDRTLFQNEEWKLTLAHIEVEEDTLTAYVDYRPRGTARSLTCKYDTHDLNVILLADGRSLPSESTYCSRHPSRTWTVARGDRFRDHAVFPLHPRLTKPFTLDWQPGKDLSGTLKGLTLETPG
ncbi:serine/threonine-protein kinase [Actinocorallia populi]|uniref:serine/threonine-protein kinase n=1 Tax=Actinocorallia populi TaxID=2079200 RepID=UPI001E60314C|nr:serine/threonine-protein kinase [Actinocorallia populi]